MINLPFLRIPCNAALFFLISFSPLRAQVTSFPTARWYHEADAEPAEHPVDMQHMRLEVAFDPQKGLVKGRVTHRFRVLRTELDSLFFHAPDIAILQALSRRNPLPFRVSSEGVTIAFVPCLPAGAVDSVTFIYEAQPRKGIYFVGWNDSRNRSRKQIWTQGQGTDNRYWIPCYDQPNDKLITEMIVTFDKKYQVLSNGTKLAQRENPDGTLTWHYTMTHPHSVYLVMLAIGTYGVQTVHSRSGVPIHLWYYPEHPERINPTYSYTTECIDFMESETGVPYPWESYSQVPVQDFLYGGMENTTATVYTDALHGDKRSAIDKSYFGTNAHELAHQWFGDYVTARDGKGTWLQESFATFYGKLFRASVYGQEQYEWSRREEQNAALAASIQNQLPIVHTQAGRARVYQKGSAVLDMMRYTFGREDFNRVITHFLKNHAYGMVETNDFYQAFQDVLGYSPAWFFEEWLYRGGEPEYEIRYWDIVDQHSNAPQTHILVRQIHQVDELVKLFRMPVAIQVHYTDGSCDSTRVWIEEQSTFVTIPNVRRRAVAFVLFDPGSQILKKVRFKKSTGELQAQALRAPHVIDRYDALVGLRETPIDRKRDVLLKAFESESFAEIKAEIVTQLGADSAEGSVELMKRALKASAPAVRTAAVGALKTIPRDVRPVVESLLADSSYGVVSAALTKLTAHFPADANTYLDETEDCIGPAQNVRILWHELNASQGRTSSIEALIDLTSPSYEFNTRVNAFEALKRLNVLDDHLLPHLFDAMVHFNSRLRDPATAVAQYFCQQSKYRQLMRRFYDGRSWTVWQRLALEKTLQ